MNFPTDAVPRQPLDRLSAVMVFLVILTVAGGYLLLSAAESLTLVDGAVEWQAQSPLRAVVQLLCLDYRFPTLNAGDVKGYILGIGAGIALIAVGVAVLAGSEAQTAAGNEEPPRGQFRAGKLTLLATAQLVAILFVLWSAVSARWSPAPEMAIAASLVLAAYFLWSIALGNGLSPSAGRIVSRGLVVITLLTGCIAVWYYYGRNPTLRAKFPFGNPTFLAPSLLVGLVLAVAGIVHAVKQLAHVRRGASLVWGIVCLSTLLMAGWAFILADARAAQVGLGAAVLAMMFFGLRGRWKAAPAILSVVLAIGAAVFYVQSAPTSRTGRGESLKLRGYAWNYALRMLADRPVTGFGQGGFTLLGDTFVPADILKDPPVFEARIDHAHNEWLETLSDLGIVGGLLIAAVFTLTFWAASRALRQLPHSEVRWTLAGLAAALAGLIVEETASVGLRVSEVPVAFYTVLGLTWALSSAPAARESLWAGMTSWRKPFVGSASLAAGLGILLMCQLDFDSARSSFRAQELLSEEKYEEALVYAQRARWRLHPQRELVSRFHLSQTHVAMAERLLHRAADRNRRAFESELPEERLLALARADAVLGDQHAQDAGHVLKELLKRSPRFFHSGYLEFRIHAARAQAANLRQEAPAADSFRRSATAALERELERQPFNADLSATFALVTGTEYPAGKILLALARPLRFARLCEGHLSALRKLGGRPEFASDLANEILQPADPALHDWKPELLRMSAALAFLHGEYGRAHEQLASAATLYASLPDTLGKAACHAELAESLFYADPERPEPAITAAQAALRLAPQSRLGREFQQIVRQRLIHYHLAAGDEPRALALLRESAPPQVTEEGIWRELGVRFRSMCESLLLHRKEALILRKPAESLLPRMRAWLARSVELNPDDPGAHFLSADLALHAQETAEAVDHLRRALLAGLDPGDARRFLEMARDRDPLNEQLQALWNELAPPGDLASDKKSP